MPVPVSVRPVLTKIVLSERISIHEASREGSAEFCRGAGRRCAGTASDTKSAPPILTNPRREMTADFGDSTDCTAPSCVMEKIPQECMAFAARCTASIIAAYVPQRHKCGDGSLFVKASLICCTVGFGFFASSSTATIIIPLWQYPHCGTCSSIHACCTGCSVFAASSALKCFCSAQTAWSPSIVVSFLPTTYDSGVTHARISSPSRSTAQEPHCAMPQPSRGPVSFSSFRSTYRTGVSGEAETACSTPFTFRVTSGGMFDLLLSAALPRGEHEIPGRETQHPVQQYVLWTQPLQPRTA